jgi:hypothetical protein|tara:strand:- start:749 stop:919 length:171 start_codon:yes stop_codon:yes gene_type:complete
LEAEDKKWLADKSAQMGEIRKKMIDLVKRNGSVFGEVLKIQEEFLNKIENIIKEKK